MCEARNDVGKTSAEFSVEVLSRPKAGNYSATVRVVEGASAKLECKVEGNPEPSIRHVTGVKGSSIHAFMFKLDAKR